jgi:nucleotide-binding universal stress UspA family protein
MWSTSQHFAVERKGRTALPVRENPGHDDDVSDAPPEDAPPVGDEVADAPADTHERHDDERLNLRGPVVVGVDGSPEARRGLLFAADLAETLDVELVVVHAYGLVGSVGDWKSGVSEHERQIDAAMVDEWCAPLAGRTGLAWRWRCVRGSAVDGVLRAADEADAAFIVVGSHGAGNSSAPLLGSTSHYVVRNSHRPVVVIPPGDDHPHRRSGAGAMSRTVADG